MNRATLETWTYTALRIVTGCMFAMHGLQKVFGVLTTHAPVELLSQKGLGGVIELVGGALIALGLFTRPAAFLSSGTMAVAYIQFHWKFAMGAQFLPIINDGELSVVYCFLFLLFAVRGAGPASLDAIVRRRT